VRQYGLERLADAGEEEAVRGRHRDFYLALAEQAAPELETGRQPDLVAALDPEAANLAAAIDHALGSTPPLAVRLCAAVYRYWASRRRFTESELAFSRWLEACGARDSALSARALRGRAYLAIQAGKYEAAEAHATGCPRPGAGRSRVLAWDDDDRHG
jgi:non-specific serine/threonine protein kinase